MERMERMEGIEEPEGELKYGQKGEFLCVVGTGKR
jgi:hypothetical protein